MTEAGRLVGLVSERDVYLLQSLHGVRPDEEPVEEAAEAVDRAEEATRTRQMVEAVTSSLATHPPER